MKGDNYFDRRSKPYRHLRRLQVQERPPWRQAVEQVSNSADSR